MTLLPAPSGRIAEDRQNCELISKQETAIQQLVLMALSENPVVVRQACKTIGEGGHGQGRWWCARRAKGAGAGRQGRGQGRGWERGQGGGQG